MRLWRKLKYFFSKKNIDFNKPMIAGFIANEHIPDSVFEQDIGLYNYGFDEKLKKYKVLVSPFDRQLEV